MAAESTLGIGLFRSRFLGNTLIIHFSGGGRENYEKAGDDKRNEWKRKTPLGVTAAWGV